MLEQRSECGQSKGQEHALFSALRFLSHDMTTEGRVSGRKLDLRSFEALADNLAIVRPGTRFGDFRFEYYGCALAENSPGGDLTGMAFGDLFGSTYYRRCLSGFRHVHQVSLPHVTRDHPVVGGAGGYFTRLLVPIFAGRATSLIVCTAHLHPEPLGDVQLMDAEAALVSRAG